MNEPLMPTILDVEHVLVPDQRESYVGRDRYIVVAIGVFNSIVTAHVIKAVGGRISGPLDGMMLRLFDDSGIEYPVSSGGSGGYIDGRPSDVSQIFVRPAGTSPKRLDLFAETRSEGTRLQPLATVEVPEGR